MGEGVGEQIGVKEEPSLLLRERQSSQDVLGGEPPERERDAHRFFVDKVTWPELQIADKRIDDDLGDMCSITNRRHNLFVKIITHGASNLKTVECQALVKRLYCRERRRNADSNAAT